MALNKTESSTFSQLSSQVILAAVQLKELEKKLDLVSSSSAGEVLTESVEVLQKQIRQIEKSIRHLEDERQSFHTLVSTGRLINSSLDPDEVLQLAMDNIIRLTDAERGFLMLRDSKGKFIIQVARNWEQENLEDEEFSISKTVISRVVESKAPVLTTNAQEDPRFFGQDSIVAYSLRSILCVPLVSKRELIGVIYADNRLRSGLFTKNDRNALQAFANQAAVAIENARLYNSLKQSLEEVTELKNLMDSVFDSMASGVLTTDSEQTVQLCNPAAGGILGDANFQVIGKKLDEVLPMLSEKLQHYLQMTIDQKVTFTGLETSEELPPRGRIDLRFSLSPLMSGENAVQGIAVVMEDETENKQLKAQRRLFERMVSPAVIDQLDPENLDLKGRRVILTTLFADIRGFTSFSEQTSPDRLFRLLNRHLAQAADAILAEDGTIDKFQGDAVMAWFNAPIPQKDHPIRAIRAALAIQRQLDSLHGGISAEEQLSFGVGIHVGEAMLGLVGTEKRLEYTAIGDSVNTAKRVQENAKPGQILITGNLYELVKGQVKVRRVEPIHAKGKREPLPVYEVIGLRRSLLH